MVWRNENVAGGRDREGNCELEGYNIGCNIAENTITYIIKVEEIS